MTSIGDSAFELCSSMLSVTIGDNIISVGDGAFLGCSSLVYVAIGKSITSIGQSAFSGCNALTNFYCYAITPPKIGTRTFNHNKNKVTLHVPIGCKTKYESVVWKNYFSNIVEME